MAADDTRSPEKSGDLLYAVYVRCSNCNKSLTSSAEWVEDHDNLLCTLCYQQLMYPSLDDGFPTKLTRP